MGLDLQFETHSLKIILHLTEFFLLYFIDYAIRVVLLFSPLYSPLPCKPPPIIIPHLSSCPWVIHISSLAFLFPILFLTFPCLFCTCHLYFLFPVPLPPFSPTPLPTDNPPCDLYICESVPLLAVCLVCFCFCYFRFGLYLWVCCHFSVQSFDFLFLR